MTVSAPKSYVTKDSAATLILHGTADPKVPTSDSQRLISALKVAGVDATLDLQIFSGHDIGQLLSPLAMQSVTAFLDQQLRGVRARGGTSNYLATPLTEYIDPVALDLGGTQYKLYSTPVRGANTFASYRIYLPPDYQTSTTRRYPVISFLHGSLVDSKRPITSGKTRDGSARSNRHPVECADALVENPGCNDGAQDADACGPRAGRVANTSSTMCRRSA